MHVDKMHMSSSRTPCTVTLTFWALHLKQFLVSVLSEQKHILNQLSPVYSQSCPFLKRFPDKFVLGHWSQGQSWGGELDNELLLCFIPLLTPYLSPSSSLPSPILSLCLCLLIVHVTMSITQLLISFGLRNSSADLSEAAGWNLLSVIGA